MMTDKFTFELVTPEHQMIEDQFDMVVVPGEAGDFGVLPNHAPVISSLRAGVIVMFNDGAKSRIFVTGGFAEITAERLTVMAEEAVGTDKIERGALEKEIDDLQQEVVSGGEELEKKSTEAKLIIARAKLQAIEQLNY